MHTISPCGRNNGVVGVKLLGAALLMAPPASHAFLSLGLGCVSCRRHNMQQFNGKVVVEVQGARHLEAPWPKNLHLIVPKSRSIIAQQYVDGYAFFHVHCSKKSQEIPKVQNFQFSSFFIRQKCVCSIVPAGQYFSNLKGKQFKSHRSVPRSTLHVITSE